MSATTAHVLESLGCLSYDPYVDARTRGHSVGLPARQKREGRGARGSLEQFGTSQDKNSLSVTTDHGRFKNEWPYIAGRRNVSSDVYFFNGTKLLRFFTFSLSLGTYLYRTWSACRRSKCNNFVLSLRRHSNTPLTHNYTYNLFFLIYNLFLLDRISLHFYVFVWGGVLLCAAEGIWL